MTDYAVRIGKMAHAASELSKLTAGIGASEGMTSFGVGSPAKEAYPLEKLQEISQYILQKDTRAYEALQYGSTIGINDLREAVRDQLLAPRGLAAKLENIMIITGGIQAMGLFCQLFINPGDVILVESPTFVHATMIFKTFEAECIPCKMDDDGLIIGELEEKIIRYKPKMIYTVPTFQNPTGVTLSRERRIQLAELASKYDVIVLEDDPYREIRYSGEEIEPIKAFDKTGNVVLANSFSKIFSPGVRLGYIVATEEIITKLRDLKLAADTCTNTISQVMCAEFFKRGYYPDHLEYLKNLYRSRRDAMLDALGKYFPKGTKYTKPDGGYYVWAELPGGLNATELAGEAVEKLNISWGLGSIFYVEGNGYGDNCMRLNFSGLTEETIYDGIEKLGKFFNSKLVK